jgi:hypothetical protein
MHRPGPAGKPQLGLSRGQSRGSAWAQRRRSSVSLRPPRPSNDAQSFTEFEMDDWSDGEDVSSTNQRPAPPAELPSALRQMQFLEGKLA